jgi:outer membrane protein assembly factor BamC
MKQRFGSLALFLVMVGVAGCKSVPFLDNKIEYKSATTLPSLEVPPDLTAPSADERYAVPDVTPQGTATFSAYSKDRTSQPEPGSTNLLPAQVEARIERAGSQRWLVAQGAPEQLWPVVRDFWQDVGFIIKEELPEAGVMETDWAENRAKIPEGGIRKLLGKVIDSVYSTPERDKFRTRLERGVAPGTTEIYISHRGMYEIYVTEGQDRTMWQPRPADPELEAEMLRRLMVRLGVQEERAKAVFANKPKTDRARLVKGFEGGGSLALDEGFDRAWRRVGLALDRVGFTVEDRDRSQGLYFVRYVDPELDSRTGAKGLLSKLIFWDTTPPDPKSKSDRYRIQVKDAEEGSRIDVLTKEGAPARSQTASRILALLHEQLK